MSVFAIPPEKPIGDYIDVFLAQSTIEEIRSRRIGSGGAVTSMLCWLLEKGKIDAVVAIRRIRGFKGDVVIARTKDEVIKASGNKWQLVPFTAKLKDAIEHSALEKVAIVALPCQAYFLRQMRDFPLLETEFGKRLDLIISLFCFGTFAHEAFLSYLKSKYNISAEQIQDIRLVGDVLTIHYDKKEVKIPTKEVISYMQVGCLVCPDYTGVFGDISAGISENYLGWTVLIARTKKGLEIIKQVADEGYITIKQAPGSVIEEIELKARAKISRASKYALALL